MADDIVNELREWGGDGSGYDIEDAVPCSMLREAADEIERLRDASEWLKQALLVTSNWWGQHHTTEEDAKYHNMVDAAIDRYKEARRG